MYANRQDTLNNFDKTDYVIANYLRISQEDDSRDESNSITNQRAMIKAYLSSRSEFSNAKVVDYVDDGISGTHTDRQAYQQLMRDIKNGDVSCIIVKDLSRIGRNLIDVDDLLMNYLVTFNTRFIAINNNYDSFQNPLSNLELAVINLANEYYSKDLGIKSSTSKRIKMKKGEYLGRFAIYGYQKSKTEKNKLVIDDEAADYVRLMYSLALDGHSATKIAKIINAQGIPTPSTYKKQHGITGFWKTTNEDYHFWTNKSVYQILTDERYTGKNISNRYTVAKYGGKKSTVLRPKEEWIIVPNTHEAIISENDFKKALECLKQVKHKNIAANHIFYDKVKCPVCGYTMRRLNKYNPRFKCTTRFYTDHYDCPQCVILQADIEKVVIESIKAYSAVLIEQEELKLSAIQKNSFSRGEIEGKIKAEQKSIRILEDSITKNFTVLASGKMSQEAFLHKKEVINNTIIQKQTELQRLNECLQAITVGKSAIDETMAELIAFHEIETLDRTTVDLLIEKIFIYGEQEIEIVWTDKY